MVLLQEKNNLEWRRKQRRRYKRGVFVCTRETPAGLRCIGSQLGSGGIGAKSTLLAGETPLWSRRTERFQFPISRDAGEGVKLFRLFANAIDNRKINLFGLSLFTTELIVTSDLYVWTCSFIRVHVSKQSLDRTAIRIKYLKERKTLDTELKSLRRTIVLETMMRWT
ncbi:hypothetical protein V1478_012099, partial [Vespula squamosa]